MTEDRLVAAKWPTSLRQRSTLLRLGSVPAVLVTPEGEGPWPLVLWLHGRSVNKEIDSARYHRLQRGGIAVCAIDLPGHGERHDPRLQGLHALADLLEQALAEVDPVLEAVLEREPRLDPQRLALGGVSAGGMVTLRRLGKTHPFRCAAVECTGGDLSLAGAPERYRPVVERGLDPGPHVTSWRPIPLLALHSEADQVIPVAAIRAFVDALREHYRVSGAEPNLARLETWPETGAPHEHLGLGKRAGQARLRLLEHLQTHLGIDTRG
jgi:dipeptidyl aminopeptidase/acylaminoacyl peptidase